jgi:hypothetical protein
MGMLQYDKHEWIPQKCTAAEYDSTASEVGQHFDDKSLILLWKVVFLEFLIPSFNSKQYSLYIFK